MDINPGDNDEDTHRPANHYLSHRGHILNNRTWDRLNLWFLFPLEKLIKEMCHSHWVLKCTPAQFKFSFSVLWRGTSANTAISVSMKTIPGCIQYISTRMLGLRWNQVTLQIWRVTRRPSPLMALFHAVRLRGPQVCCFGAIAFWNVTHFFYLASMALKSFLLSILDSQKTLR